MRSHFFPEWMTDEVDRALAAIGGDHVAKKETTVLRMAQAIALGESKASVFAQRGTCTKNVWEGYAGKPGWVNDEAIATALAVATDRARWWARVKQGRAIQDSLDILTDGAEDAAKQLVNMVRMGVLIFDFGLDGKELRRADTGHILEASKQILDRVSALTAPKSTQESIPELSDDERASRITAILEQARKRRDRQATGK